MSNGNSVNRHGIALRGIEPTCCIWPRCPAPAIGIFSDTHLCVGHARVVHGLVERVRQISERRVEIMRAAVEEPAPQVVSENGVIYYVQVGTHIKIGWTSDLEKRLRDYPPSCQLLATHPGTRTDERNLHKRFAVWRTHGREWYPLVNELTRHIRRVVDEHGQPGDVIFGARPVEVPEPRAKQYTSRRARSGSRAWRI